METRNYIEELQKSVGNKEEVERLLNDTESLQKYLETIGANPEIARRAGVLYLVQKDLEALLVRKAAVVTPKGIISSERNFFKAGDNGSLEFLLYGDLDEKYERSSHYELDASTGEVKFTEDTDLIRTIAMIDEKGVINRETKLGRIPYLMNYLEEERSVQNGVPVIISTNTNGSSFRKKTTKVDFGNPFLRSNNVTEFDRNFETYISAYPILEEWYQERFAGFETDIKGYSASLTEEQIRLDIKTLEESIAEQQKDLNSKNEKIKLLRERLEIMLEMLIEKGESNILIRSSVNQIVENVDLKDERKPDSEEVPEEDVSEQESSETLEEKRKRLTAKFERLREQNKQSSNYHLKLKAQIESLKGQIADIPLLGESLERKINQESAKQLADKNRIILFEDDEQK